MKETFIDPLLHPFSSAPVTTPNLFEGIDDFYFRPETPYIPPPAGLEKLPIASRFLHLNPSLRPDPNPQSQQNLIGSPTPVFPTFNGESSEEEDQLGRGYAKGKNRVPNSPYGPALGGRVGNNAKNLPFPSRSHVSLPPPPRHHPQASTVSLGRESTIVSMDQPGSASIPARVLSRLSKKYSTPADLSSNLNGGNGSGLPAHLLPEDLRECLEVLQNTIISGHLALHEGLRKRYEEQYPLVRSLADVFIAQVSIS